MFYFLYFFRLRKHGSITRCLSVCRSVGLSVCPMFVHNFFLFFLRLPAIFASFLMTNYLVNLLRHCPLATYTRLEKLYIWLCLSCLWFFLYLSCSNSSLFWLLFSRVLRDSTPRFVGPSVRPSVGPSVRRSVRHTLLLCTITSTLQSF